MTPHSIPGGITRLNNAFGPGTDAIVLDNVRCLGSESRLIDCPSNGILNNNCDHTKDVGITCRQGTPFACHSLTLARAYIHIQYKFLIIYYFSRLACTLQLQYTYVIGCTVGDVRLVGGERIYEGRVEICHSNEWMTVCNQIWRLSHARVVCRQLGYRGISNGQCA